MLGKPRILSLFPTRLINSIKHEHSFKILYKVLGKPVTKSLLNSFDKIDNTGTLLQWLSNKVLSLIKPFEPGHLSETFADNSVADNPDSNKMAAIKILPLDTEINTDLNYLSMFFGFYKSINH